MFGGKSIDYPLMATDHMEVVTDSPTLMEDSSASAEIDSPSNLYCSCNGAGKEGWALGEKFIVCAICGKEKL
jgi:hypothetical protein